MMNFNNFNNNNFNGFNPQQFSAQSQQQFGQQQNTITNGNIMVDYNFIDQSVFNLENPDFIANNAKLGYNVSLKDSVLKLTTKRILNKMNSDLSDYRKITFKYNGDPNWGLDFIMQSDKALRVKRIYINKHTNSGYYNPLESTMQDMLMAELQYTDAQNADNGYSVAFNNISSLFSTKVTDSANIYAEAIYKAIDFVVSTITSPQYIRNVNGRWVMSASLWDVLNANKISFAGIIIKPIISVTPTNQLSVSVLYDFTEELTVEFKGDKDYMNGVSFRYSHERSF